jgi:hypothetical protein
VVINLPRYVRLGLELDKTRTCPTYKPNMALAVSRGSACPSYWIRKLTNWVCDVRIPYKHTIVGTRRLSPRVGLERTQRTWMSILRYSTSVNELEAFRLKRNHVKSLCTVGGRMFTFIASKVSNARGHESSLTHFLACYPGSGNAARFGHAASQ